MSPSNDRTSTDEYAAFDRAVTAVIDGDLDTLGELIVASPDIVNARGRAPHHATLLHYVSANGVEDHLQRSPANSVHVAELLLEAGADPDATIDAYGRPATPLVGLVSSWHPFAAGVQADLVRTLVAGGAAVDGVAGDRQPLMTALRFGYTGAAEALAECGADHSGLLPSAGLGLLEAVQLHLSAPADDATSTGAEVHRSGLVQEALHYAVTHDRVDVAELLLDAGADPNGSVADHHCDLPLVQALFVRSVDVVPLLVARGADPMRRDDKRAMTALELVDQFGPKEAREHLAPGHDAYRAGNN